jgi:hypothetical protein
VAAATVDVMACAAGGAAAEAVSKAAAAAETAAATGGAAAAEAVGNVGAAVVAPIADLAAQSAALCAVAAALAAAPAGAAADVDGPAVAAALNTCAPTPEVPLVADGVVPRPAPRSDFPSRPPPEGGYGPVAVTGLAEARAACGERGLACRHRFTCGAEGKRPLKYYLVMDGSRQGRRGWWGLCDDEDECRRLLGPLMKVRGRPHSLLEHGRAELEVLKHLLTGSSGSRVASSPPAP